MRNTIVVYPCSPQIARRSAAGRNLKASGIQATEMWRACKAIHGAAAQHRSVVNLFGHLHRAKGAKKRQRQDLNVLHLCHTNQAASSRAEGAQGCTVPWNTLQQRSSTSATNSVVHTECCIALHQAQNHSDQSEDAGFGFSNPKSTAGAFQHVSLPSAAIHSQTNPCRTGLANRCYSRPHCICRCTLLYLLSNNN